jgi:hypothetical protein
VTSQRSTPTQTLATARGVVAMGVPARVLREIGSRTGSRSPRGLPATGTVETVVV